MSYLRFTSWQIESIMKSCSFIAGNTKFYQDTVLGSDERNVCRHYKGSHWQGDLFACHMITCLTGLISLGFLPLCVISSLSYRTSTINCSLNLKVLCICFLVHHCIFFTGTCWSSIVHEDYRYDLRGDDIRVHKRNSKYSVYRGTQ